MRKLALLVGFIFSSSAMAFVTVHDSSDLDHAREKQLIAPQTMMVKVSSLETFASDFSYLGQFKPFLDTKAGTWVKLSLNMLPDGESAALLLNDLSRSPNIIHAYFAPVSKNANIETNARPAPEQPMKDPEDYSSFQNYLDEAPRGVGARKAWQLPGGRGENVRIIDIEVCWSDKHKDFMPPFYIGANPDCPSTDHGTAVWGEIAAKDDGKGVVGIAHGADFGIYGFSEGDWDEVDDQYTYSINRAIKESVDQLQPGDVLVIEQQMVGPDLRKNTAVEYWPHIFDQLKLATDKGIICVEAAGNGSSNFDEPIYRGAFDLKVRDSGCIIVGAVGQGSMNRLSFSNYGKRLDASAYGNNVVTTGYGDLFNGGDDNTYTARFAGTSSATPIVAGAVAVVSSLAKQQGRTISPKEMRDALRATGTPQGRATVRTRVGSFPVIQQLMDQLQIK